MTFFGIFLSKKWKKPAKMSKFYIILENLANCPEQCSFFASLKEFQPKLWPFWHFYTQKWKNLQSCPSPPFWLKFHFLVFGHVIFIHTFLARPQQHFCHFWFLIYNSISLWPIYDIYCVLLIWKLKKQVCLTLLKSVCIWNNYLKWVLLLTFFGC